MIATCVLVMELMSLLQLGHKVAVRQRETLTHSLTHSHTQTHTEEEGKREREKSKANQADTRASLAKF